MTLPNDDEQLLLDQLIENEPIEVNFHGKTVVVDWLKRGTIRKISHIMAQKGNDDKATCQAAAAVILNGYWSIKFFWWLKWRWYYYIKQYDDSVLNELLQAAKKKVPLKSYFLATTFLTAITDLKMMMTKKEVSNIRQEQATDKGGNSAKSDNG